MKMNAWRLTRLPEKVHITNSFKGFKEGKKNLSQEKKIGWHPIKDGVAMIGDTDSQMQYNAIDFRDIDRNLQISLIHSRIKNYFTQLGYSYNKSSDLYYLSVDTHPKAAIFSSENNVFVNIGFKYAIERVGNFLALVINPFQVTTTDGNNYSRIYSKRVNHLVLADAKVKPSYNKMVDMYKFVISSFTSNNSFGISCGSCGNIDFRESKQIKVSTLPEPELYFGSGKKDKWPKLGLNKYGPLDANIGKQNRPANIRMVYIGSKDSFGLMNLLNAGEKDKKYPFKGFKNIFSSSLTMGAERFYPLSPQEISGVKSVEAISDLIVSKLVELKNRGVDFDIGMIELPKEWEEYYNYQPVDLHDLIKVQSWQRRFTTQLFLKHDYNESEITDHLNNLALGVYHKAGGYPWKIDSKFSDCAYVGISFGYSIKEVKSLIGVAEIFDVYGQFVAMRSLTIKQKPLDQSFDSKRELHLQEGQLETLLRNLLHDYYTFKDNDYPSNLVIHKTTYFNRNEQNDVLSLVDIPANINMVYTQSSNNWHIINDKVPTRGTYLRLSSVKAILYTSGILQGQSRYFLPGAPKPYLIELQGEGSFTIDDICNQIMELSKLNFNSTNTYSKHPVTILHSKKLVNLLRAGLSPDNIPSDPRYFL